MPHWGEIFSETAFVWYSDTQTKMLVACQRFGDSFSWGDWSGSILQNRTNMIKVGSKETAPKGKNYSVMGVK